MIRLDLHGRKGSSNESRGEFYTFIGKDAVAALTEYFEKERGWPKAGEAIWLNKFGKPHEYVMYGDVYLKLLRMQGLIREPNGDQSERSGMSPHEFRDCAKTYLHTNAKKHGLDIDCVDFWMGHESRDPNAYDKFMDDETYVLEQYKIAEPHLNIISQPATLALQEQTQRLEELERKNQALEAQLGEVSMFLRHVSANWQPKEPPPKEKVEIKWDPASMGLRWPLESKREKAEKTRKKP
jgi:hypothetical protein